MSSEKKTLYEIATTKLDNIVDELKNQFLIINSEQINTIRRTLKDRLNARKADIDSLEEKLPSYALYSLLREPQINDSLELYAVKTLIAAEFNIKKRGSVLKDDLFTYIIKAVEISYQELNYDSKILALKSFLNCLLEICEKKTESIDFFPMISGLLNGRNVKMPECIILSIEEKIKRIFSKEFLCKNKEFEKRRIESNKFLQARFQNDFIYLLGEHRFADFYIPPNLQIMNQIGGFPSDFDGNQPERAQYLLSQIYGILEEKLNLETQTRKERWKDIFLQHSILYLIGGTGYGKSLFLKNIINNYNRMHFDHAEDYLVVHCDLKSYYSRGEIHRSLPAFFCDSMIDLSGSDSVSKELIQYYITTGRCMVLLDALDEVPKGGRQDLHTKIVSYFQTCNPGNKVCITSRSRGFIPEKDIEAIEIIPLNKSDIEEYLDKIIALKKFKREDKQRFLEQAQILIDRKFLSSFLVLSLLVNIYKSERELPENKIDLYKKCFEYIAKRREEEKSKTGYDWSQIDPLMKDSTFIKLSTLAAPNNHDILRTDVEKTLLDLYQKKYLDTATAENAIKEFLKFCENRTELLVSASSDDMFKFFHRSFFEFFYARYLYQCDNCETIIEKMKEFDIDSEVFELTVALIKADNEEKYQNLMESIFTKTEFEFDSQNSEKYSCTAFSILTLAMQAVDDELYIRRYSNILINYKEYMDSKNINRLSQLIFVLASKSCSNDEDKRAFLAAFEKKCIQYVLSSVYYYKELVDLNGYKNEQTNHERIYSLELNRKYNIYKTMRIIKESSQLPFYILFFEEFGDLFNLMEQVVKGDVDFLSKLVKGRKNRQVKRDLEFYKKLSEDQRKELIDLIVRRKKM